MLGWVILIGASICMARVAESEGKSGALWGFLTFLICLACGFIPLPLINMGIGFAISFVLMTVVNMKDKN